jgi:hypothetical protein
VKEQKTITKRSVKPEKVKTLQEKSPKLFASSKFLVTKEKTQGKKNNSKKKVKPPKKFKQDSVTNKKPYTKET